MDTDERKRRGYPRRITDDVVDEMERLYADEHSTIEIARMLGVGKSSVSARLKERGVELRPATAQKRGPASVQWKGGRTSSGPEGYVLVYVPDGDPFVGTRLPDRNYALEHRLVMARHLGRDLRPDETVHHINGDRTDNRIENLQLRVGQHGSGQALRCRSCGSCDVEAVGI